MGELTLTSSVIRVVRRAHAVEAACTPARSNPSTKHSIAAPHRPPPTRQTYEHIPPPILLCLVFSSSIHYYASHLLHPCHPYTTAYTSPSPTRSLSHITHPRLPVPDTPSVL
jgi:hypothetical protein